MTAASSLKAVPLGAPWGFLSTLWRLVKLPYTLWHCWLIAWRAVPGHVWSHFKPLAALHLLQVSAQSRKGPCTQRMFGFTVTGRNPAELIYLFREVFLSGEYTFRADTKAPLIIDCGANIGMSILFFKRCWPEARIVAFEANPQVFELLKCNVEQNGLGNVELHNVALADTEGALGFYVGRDPGTLESLTGSVRADRGGTVRIDVPSRRLSTLLKSLDETVDAVKIDIEGAEWMVLKDLVDSGAITLPKRYLVEYHHKLGNDKGRMGSFLRPFEEAGFDYTIRAEPHQDVPFQDVLLHFQR